MTRNPLKNLHLKLLMLPVTVYQYCISPFTASSCRYQPTCSSYTKQAIATHGIKGVWMAMRRLSRCHPWGSSGYDPVPQKKDTIAFAREPSERCNLTATHVETASHTLAEANLIQEKNA